MHSGRAGSPNPLETHARHDDTFTDIPSRCPYLSLILLKFYAYERVYMPSHEVEREEGCLIKNQS
jgi:hypothetical protein